MAKAKKKSAKAGKLPKTVAGIALPKELRKQGAKLLDLIKNPMVGDLVAAGLVALAANVRNQGKTANAAEGNGPKDRKDKTATAEALGKTAATLATVVAARAAEKITSKLAERPAPTAPAAPTPPSPAAAPKPAARKPATRKPAARPKAPAKPAAKPAAAKTAAAKPKAPAARKPAAKTAARKPTARKPAAKPAS